MSNMKELISYITNYMRGMTCDKIILIISAMALIWCGMLSSLKIQKAKMYRTRVIGTGLLSFILSNIIGVTLLGRTVMQNAVWQLQPFWSYLSVVHEGDRVLLAQIVWNIIVFIPVGFLLPMCFPLFRMYHRALGVVIVMACAVELTQGITRIGWFEIDDIINNLLGTAIGVGVYVLCKKMLAERKKKKSEELK